MKLTPTATAVLTAFALLTACSPKGGASAGGAPAAPASGPDVQSDLSNMPHQRAGLWKSVIDDGDGKPETTTTCMSGKAPPVPKTPAGCSQFSIKRTFLGAYVMDINCATADYTMVDHAVLTGDLQSHVTGDSTMTMSTKQTPTRTIKMHNEATWIGPCAPGQKPDDADVSNTSG